MRRPAARVGRALGPIVLGWLLFCAAGFPAGADARFPVTLEQVPTGEPESVVPGTAALHVVFFAAWCPPCTEELGRLAEMEQRWAERGYRVVLIAVRNRNTRERLLRFAEQHEVPGSLFLDTTGDAQRSFEVHELPAHFLFDASGRELGRWSALGGDLQQAVRDLLQSPKGT